MALAEYDTMTLQSVEGHQGNPENKKAKLLAKQEWRYKLVGPEAYR